MDEYEEEEDYEGDEGRACEEEGAHPVELDAAALGLHLFFCSFIMDSMKALHVKAPFASTSL